MCICHANVPVVCATFQIFQAIISTFVHGFQNNLAQLFALRSKSAILNICTGRLKVKVTLEGQNDKMVIN